MTDIKVTQADIDTVRQIRLSDQVWYQQDRVARHRIEAQRPLLEALEELEAQQAEITAHEHTIEGLWDEITRLREALGRVRDTGNDGEHSGDRHSQCRVIARKALEQKP